MLKFLLNQGRVKNRANVGSLSGVLVHLRAKRAWIDVEAGDAREGLYDEK